MEAVRPGRRHESGREGSSLARLSTVRRALNRSCRKRLARVRRRDLARAHEYIWNLHGGPISQPGTWQGPARYRADITSSPRQWEFSRSSAGIQRDVPGALPELLGGDALAISRDLIVRPQTPIQVREPVHHCVHLFNVGRLVVRIPWSGAPCARPMVPTTFSPTIRSRSETQ